MPLVGPEPPEQPTKKVIMIGDGIVFVCRIIQLAPPPPPAGVGWFQLYRDHTFPSSDPESDGPTTSNLKWSVT